MVHEGVVYPRVPFCLATPPEFHVTHIPKGNVTYVTVTKRSMHHTLECMYLYLSQPIDLLSTTIQNIGEDNTQFSFADTFSVRVLPLGCCPTRHRP